MKKYWLLALLLLFPFDAAEAKLADERIAIGGMTPGSPEEYIVATYGPPTRKERSFYAPRNEWIDEYVYGDSFFISVLEKEKQVFRIMSLGQKNGLATPDGIAVGARFTDVIAKYGEPDLRQIDGDTDYFWYFGDSEKGNLVFHVSFGYVTGIVCGRK